MSKYQAYPKYKDSGVEWLKEIPKDWSVVPLKYIAELTPKKSELEESIMSDKCTFLPMEKLKLNSITLDETRTVKDVYDGYTYFRNGDVLIAKVTPCFENKNMAIAADLTNGIGFGSSEIYVLRPNDSINNRFLYYRLQEDNFMAVATGAMTGAGGLKRVPSETVNNFTIAIPTTNEQNQIAAFLDHETAKIDTLIGKQQQLIELLKEKRQAVISHAVTKGLNPDAPMKDSGVEWLGAVPEHWDVIYIKHLSEVKRGASPRPIDDPKYFDENGEYAWTRIADVSKAGMYLTNTTQRLSKLGSSLSVKLEPNELFLSIAGTVGKPCLTISKACIHDGFVYFPSLKINNKFLYYIFEAGQAYLGLGKMGTQLNLNTDTVGGIKIGLPSKQEIEQIIIYIEKQKDEYNTLIKKASDSINLMHERRTALISAAVTGKIDVRNWVAPATSSGTNEAQKEVTA
ncbi:restriction endonuclease subunit S [Photobacterium kishitanii]|uniref:restriction endonuclease subunit S n=1 Tax=Photobacterium kishitanii TaxID=318456 RepID=UPI0007EFB315|nr:restriction endonuclease subunit S [Photobacterium kishitanii]OBU28321.1 hypothetical protein AYY22_13760 [Photobacterium kishitanii]PSW69853.1 restriction endonuclease subunit S [Photobacterium kishitanii]